MRTPPSNLTLKLPTLEGVEEVESSMSLVTKQMFSQMKPLTIDRHFVATVKSHRQ